MNESTTNHVHPVSGRQGDGADIQRGAQILGYAGVLPFLPALALLWLPPGDVTTWVQKSLLAYAAVILSFVGALHWSAALDSHERRTAAARLGFSVLPALIGWLGLLAPPAAGFMLMMTGFIIAYLVDQRWWLQHRWFLRLRGHLSAGALGALALGLLSTFGVI